MRLVYLGAETERGGDETEAPDSQGREDRRRMVLVALAAVGLGAILVYMMALGGGAHEKSSARPKAEPVFGYVVREVRGPGLKR
jgi:hypothetical protein